MKEDWHDIIHKCIDVPKNTKQMNTQSHHD